MPATEETSTKTRSTATPTVTCKWCQNQTWPRHHDYAIVQLTPGGKTHWMPRRIRSASPGKPAGLWTVCAYLVAPVNTDM